jgi:hypothetical protein
MQCCESCGMERANAVRGWVSWGGHARISCLTLASQIAKIIYASRQPKGDSRGDRPAQ